MTDAINLHYCACSMGKDDNLPDNFKRRFGRRLKLLRVTRGLTQGQLAERAGMHRTFIGNLERAQRGMNVHRLPYLAAALGLEPRDLLPGGAGNLDEPEQEEEASS
jgi:transcriptional regulator with XRE-family HTH domain